MIRARTNQARAEESMKSVCLSAVGCLLACAAGLPATASAQSADEWQFQGTIYLYLPTVGGKTTVPEPGGDFSIDILDSLNMTFMGSLEARKGRWGAFTDLIYLDLGNTKTQSREITIGTQPLPAGATANVGLDLNGKMWTLAGTYRLVTDPASPLDLMVGARLFDLKHGMNWQISGNVGSIPLPGRAGSSEGSPTNWDAIAGVKGRFALGADSTWFIPYYADVGTGDSDLTWQLMGGAGYTFGWGEVLGAWRHIDYGLKSGSTIKGLTFDGPAIAAVFRW